MISYPEIRNREIITFKITIKSMHNTRNNNNHINLIVIAVVFVIIIIIITIIIIIIVIILLVQHTFNGKQLKINNKKSY